MTVELRSLNKDYVYLVGKSKHQITGAKLPSKRQILSVLFFNIRQVKLTVSESANLVIRECIIFWEKARIPTKAIPNCVKKLVDLYNYWRELQKNSSKARVIHKKREEIFRTELDNLFDIAHADALDIMKIEEDKVFLQKQREPGRPGCLAGVDKKLAEKEERSRQRKLLEEQRLVTASTSTLQESQDPCISSSDEEPLPEISTAATVLGVAETSSGKRGRKDLVSPKLVAALDRCQLSVRDSVYILQAAIEALGMSLDEYPVNKSSIQRVRSQMRKERAETIKSDFQDHIPDIVTVHWDGKMLPGLDVRSSKEERLPVLISYGKQEQLLAVPKLESSSGKDQAKAVLNALHDWNLNEVVQIMCCDTTASNTGRFNGACALLEQRLERELLLFACRHHVYELVLKSVFEAKIPQVTKSPDIPLFKKFRDNWNTIDSTLIETCPEFVAKEISDEEIHNLLVFYRQELDKSIVRDDYRELVELSVIFLGGDNDKRYKIKPPGAMHQARWMARAIYSLKIFLLKRQFKLSAKEGQALRDISLFISTIYVKPWLQCGLAVKAPNQDLCFIKSLKDYEKVDAIISQAALSKLCQHLWYLSEEAVLLSIFDDSVDDETKEKIVHNLDRESSCTAQKRYIPSKEEQAGSLYGMFSVQ